MKAVTFFLVVFCATLASAAEPVQSGLVDPFLDNLVGDWHIDRKFGSGRVAENTVHAEWVLNHQFVELHYRDVAVPPKYEAMVFIGYDKSEQRYVCHWIDNFGGQFSGLAYGKIGNDKRAVEFTFNYKDGPFTNKFSFDPATKTWTSLMRQQENGTWKVFAEDKFTPVEAKR
jgi:hypothetical protein